MDTMQGVSSKHPKERKSGSEKKPKRARKSTEAVPMETTILMSDDRFYLVFSLVFPYLSIASLLQMEKVCEEFKAIAEKTFQSRRVLDFNEFEEGSLTPEDAQIISAKLGPFVRSLKVNKETFSDISRSLVDILRNCGNLENLELIDCDIRNSSGSTKILIEMFANLKEACLDGCDVTDQLAANFFANAQSLESVDLSMNYEMYGKCLTVLTNIKKIALYDCIEVVPRYFIRFCMQNKELKSLNIAMCRNLNSLCLKTIAKELKNLETLAISTLYNFNNHPALVPASNFLVLADLPSLKELSITFNNVFNLDRLLEKLAEKNQLQFLDIASHDMTKGAMKALSKFSKLKVLRINGKYSFDGTLIMIASFNTLEELTIVNCLHNYNIRRCITKEGLLHFVMKCPLLTHLEITGGPTSLADFIVSLKKRGAERTKELKVFVRGQRILKFVKQRQKRMRLDDNNKIKVFAISPEEYGGPKFMNKFYSLYDTDDSVHYGDTSSASNSVSSSDSDLDSDQDSDASEDLDFDDSDD